MTISIKVGKAFDNFQHLFMIKALNNLGIERTFLNKIRAIYAKLTDNIIFNGERNDLLFKIRTKQREQCTLCRGR